MAVMPRIHPLADPDPETAEILAKAGLHDGKPLNIFATFAHHPRLLKRFLVLGGFFLGRGLLPERDREIVILRTAWRSRSEYEFGQHTRIGRLAGLSEGEIRALTVDEPGLGGHAAVLVSVADEIASQAVLSDSTWTALMGLYDHPQAIEVIMLAGFYRMLAGVLNSVQVQLEDGTPGWPD